MDTQKNFEITVIGAAILDVLAQPVTAEVFQTGSRPVERTNLSPGGDAFNEAILLSRFGKRVELVSKVGDDLAGDAVLQLCGRNGLDTSRIRREAGLATGVNVVLTDPAGERYFLTNPHSSLRTLCEADLDPWLDGAADLVSFASLFVSPLLPIPAVERVFRRLKARPGRVLCADMTKAKHGERLEDLAGILPLVDFLFPNAQEAALLTGDDDPERSARRLVDAGVGCAAVKCGSRGCLLATRDGCRTIPAYPDARCVDTTGAGDTFAAGFLWALSEGWELPACARLACAAASCAVEKLGATDATRSLDEALERFRKPW